MGRMETLEHAGALERGFMDIGRASQASGVSVKMIRHYEAIGLLPKVARTLANAAVKRISAKHIEDLKRKIAELKSMVQTLEHLTKHCHGDHRPECPILDDLASR